MRVLYIQVLPYLPEPPGGPLGPGFATPADLAAAAAASVARIEAVLPRVGVLVVRGERGGGLAPTSDPPPLLAVTGRAATASTNPGVAPLRGYHL